MDRTPPRTVIRSELIALNVVRGPNGPELCTDLRVLETDPPDPRVPYVVHLRGETMTVEPTP